MWVGVFVALLAVHAYPRFVPDTGQDSFQYLSVARNAVTGRIGYTSLVHFDVERSFGTVPAPMVTFPVGYPLAIATVSLLGLSLQNAGFLVSAASMVTCLLLLEWIERRLGWSRALRNATIAIFIFNATVVEYAASLNSEALFTCVTLLGVALLVRARLEPDPRSWLWLAAGLAFGATYFVRYAGLFWLIGLALITFRHVLDRNRRLVTGYGIALLTASVFVLAGVARNIVLVGNWAARPHGHIESQFALGHTLLALLKDTVAALKDLFLGPGFGLLAGPALGTGGISLARGLVLVSVIAAAVAWLMRMWATRAEARSGDDANLRALTIDLLLVAVAYLLCMYWAGLTAVISYGTRYFVPLLPVLIMLIGLAAQSALTVRVGSHASRTPLLLALVATLCSYVILNAFLLSRSPSIEASFARLMAAPPTQTTLARSLLAKLLGADGVIIANNGQVVGHAFNRPTVSLVAPHYSRVEWNEEAVRRLVEQYKAAAIVIYVPTGAEWNDDDIVPSSFVRQLAQGVAPSWMNLVYRSEDLVVYSPVRPLPEHSSERREVTSPPGQHQRLLMRPSHGSIRRNANSLHPSSPALVVSFSRTKPRCLKNSKISSGFATSNG
jgi:hypothetical protein